MSYYDNPETTKPCIIDHRSDYRRENVEALPLAALFAFFVLAMSLELIAGSYGAPFLGFLFSVDMGTSLCLIEFVSREHDRAYGQGRCRV